MATSPSDERPAVPSVRAGSAVDASGATVAPDAGLAPSALPDPSPTITVDGLTLRPLEARDEAQALAAVVELAPEGFDFLMGYDEQLDFTGVREAFARDARGAGDPRWVPSSLLVAEDGDGSLVGRVSVRWELNDVLRHVNGHVGYAVRPAFRRRGHARRMLRGALALLHARGVASALVTCGASNTGSAAVIRSCGGVLRDRVDRRFDGAPAPEPTLRFDVPTAPLD